MNPKKIMLWIVTVSFLLSGLAFASNTGRDGNTAVAGKFDSYVFSLSWQPTFCETKPDKKECVSQTPDRYDAKNLILHGLWPNKNADTHHKYGFCGVKSSVRKLDKASTWCKMPAPDLSDETKNTLAQYMPGVDSCLERHEWHKHGTCSGIEADNYFTLASSLVSKVDDTNFNKYISNNIGNTININDLLAEFEKDFGRGSNSYVNLFCEKVNNVSMLSEVRMYLSKDLSAEGQIKDFLIKPSGGEKGNCPQDIFIDPVHRNIAPSIFTRIFGSTRSLTGPAPLLAKGHSVDWWFVFKFNAATFPDCDEDEERSCPFGGQVQTYKNGLSWSGKIGQ